MRVVYPDARQIPQQADRDRRREEPEQAMACLEHHVEVVQLAEHADSQADGYGQHPQPGERPAPRGHGRRADSRVEPVGEVEQRVHGGGDEHDRDRARHRHPAVWHHPHSPPRLPTASGRSAGLCSCCQAAASGVVAFATATRQPEADKISAVRAVSSAATSVAQLETASTSAIAGAFPRLLAASILASSADSRPSTAMICPPALVSAVVPGPNPATCEGLMTASMSSSVSWNVPRGAISPSSVMSLARNPSPDRCAPIEAAALTANSNVAEVLPAECALRRVSRKTDALLRHWCSSRRTISSPYRAVDRQCTRRSPSPSW